MGAKWRVKNSGSDLCRSVRHVFSEARLWDGIVIGWLLNWIDGVFLAFLGSGLGPGLGAGLGGLGLGR